MLTKSVSQPREEEKKSVQCSPLFYMTFEYPNVLKIYLFIFKKSLPQVKSCL